jgi:uncharacterized protein YecT (DUF1311 family)
MKNQSHILPKMFAILAFALQPLAAQASINCQQQAGGQMQMDECARADYDKSVTELLGVYDQIMARLKDLPDERKRLIEAERTWNKYRDAQCEFVASGVRGGSVWPWVYTTCQERITQAHTHELRRFLRCEDGALSCPVPAAPNSH